MQADYYRDKLLSRLHKCDICPRQCHADRIGGERGYCGAQGENVDIARVMIHHWEEPCISGNENNMHDMKDKSDENNCGSGAVFFAHCPLQCVYCQNSDISDVQQSSSPAHTKNVSPEELVDILLLLQSSGALNINLVTPTHYAVQIFYAVTEARSRGLEIPVIYNCGGYESVETLRLLESAIDIYLCDIKYFTSVTAKQYSNAADYPEVSAAALREMVRQQPVCEYDERGIMKKGVIVRHLVLPEHSFAARSIIKRIYKKYGDSVVYSIMNQYTPMKGNREVTRYPELLRAVSADEYDEVVSYAEELGIERAYIQAGEAADAVYIPQWGVKTCDGKIILE